MCSSSILKQDGLHMQKQPMSTYGRLAADMKPNTLESGQNGQQSESDGFMAFVKAFLLMVFVSFSVLEFSVWFPFNIPGVTTAAIETYIPAWYKYDPEHTKFDNTPWTYNTDYALTAFMSYLAIKCLMETAPDNCPKKNADSLKLRLYSAALLICYAISTLAGGWSHQHITSIEMLNSTRFRVLWFLCVGNVSFASCYMGLIGREVQQVFGVKDAIPLGPWWFWPGFGSYIAGACALGYFSFKRPACDIFIAGTSQFLSTFYCLGALGLRKWSSKSSLGNGEEANNESPIGLVRLSYRLMFYVGFIGNSPLLPLYPALVQYSGWSLAGINTFLHCWLMVMWGMQGISLLHLCKAMGSYKPKVSKD